MKVAPSLLGFDHLLLDCALVPSVLKSGLSPVLEALSARCSLHVAGDPGALGALVRQSGGLELPEDAVPQVSRVSGANGLGNPPSCDLSKLLGVPASEMRERVLYVKSTQRHRVLFDRHRDQRDNWQSIARSRDCHLRLVASCAETCSFRCIYCFASYGLTQPTTILFDCADKLARDLVDPHVSSLLEQGKPIYLGSHSDPFSPECVLFGVAERMITALAGHRVFTVTKSPLVAAPRVLTLLKQNQVKVAFTYTGLVGFERNLPYDARALPAQVLRELIDHGIDTVLLYKPVVPGINDGYGRVLQVLKAAAASGVREVSTGFLQMDPEMEKTLARAHPRPYSYFKEVLTDKVRDESIPSLEYRQGMARMFSSICGKLGLRLSFCQVYIGELREELATSSCLCRRERWSKQGLRSK